jgi:hypothetical protein
MFDFGYVANQKELKETIRAFAETADETRPPPCPKNPQGSCQIAFLMESLVIKSHE